MEDILSWVATAATITAACMTASNLGARITGYGFAVFTIGSIAWLGLGLVTGQPALVWTNVALTFLNLFGIWRWLGRQAKVEAGAQRATEKSEALPTQTLFPASWLLSAKLAGDEGEELGTLVDGMIGCGNGKLSYVVVAQGGVAGVGEQLRRLEWSDAEVDGDLIRAKLDKSGLDRLPQLARDDWPGR
jgi:high-affinity Fe2+/Pb2+ permease